MSRKRGDAVFSCHLAYLGDYIGVMVYRHVHTQSALHNITDLRDRQSGTIPKLNTSGELQADVHFDRISERIVAHLSVGSKVPDEQSRQT